MIVPLASMASVAALTPDLSLIEKVCRYYAEQGIEISRLLVDANRPLLLAGGGVVRSEAWKEFYQLAKESGIPATTTPMGAGCMPADDNGFFGAGGWLGGDGGFGCTLQELQTAVRYNLPVINVISNDKAWGMIKGGQVALYNNPVGVDFSDANYAEIAKGFGAYGERVKDPKGIKPALEKAVKLGKPAVIDVITQTTGHLMDQYWVTLVLKQCELPIPA